MKSPFSDFDFITFRTIWVSKYFSRNFIVIHSVTPHTTNGSNKLVVCTINIRHKLMHKSNHVLLCFLSAKMQLLQYKIDYEMYTEIRVKRILTCYDYEYKCKLCTKTIKARFGILLKKCFCINRCYCSSAFNQNVIFFLLFICKGFNGRASKLNK